MTRLHDMTVLPGWEQQAGEATSGASASDGATPMTIETTPATTAPPARYVCQILPLAAFVLIFLYMYDIV